MTAAFQHYGMSDWLARTATTHTPTGSDQPGPSQPAHVALPGALEAVHIDRLHAYHHAGLDELATVGQVNGGWVDRNRARLEAHDRWARGAYRQAVDEARERHMRDQAEQMRRRAILDDILAERERD